MYRREMKELKENEELIKENRELKAEMYRTNEKMEVMDREKNGIMLPARDEHKKLTLVKGWSAELRTDLYRMSPKKKTSPQVSYLLENFNYLHTKPNGYK
jgi:predicted nuclease with TOPRIM domain